MYSVAFRTTWHLTSRNVCYPLVFKSVAKCRYCRAYIFPCYRVFLMYSVCIHVLLLMDYTTLCTRLMVYIFDVHNLNNIEAIVGKIGDTLF